MQRWLAGYFGEPDEGGVIARLRRALPPAESSFLSLGRLSVAYTGPTAPADGPLCLLDGWIDELDELRLTLGVPDTLSVEATLTAGWRTWGSELPRHLKGDFVLLIWDVRTASGLLARDQLGARPLFQHQTGSKLLFASEIRLLLASMATSPAPDTTTVSHWLSMTTPPGLGSLYEGVRRAGPASVLVLSGSRVEARTYWRPQFVEPTSLARAEQEDLVRTELTRAIARRCDDTAGSTGVLMSGGLDSSAVAAMAATALQGDLKVFSGVFPEHPDVDESALIEQLRASLHLPAVLAEVHAGGLLDSVLASVRDWRVPALAWGDFWTLPLLRAASGEGIRTMLVGDGGDEVFGARSLVMADALRAGRVLQAARLARLLPGAAYGPSRREVAGKILSDGVLAAVPHRLHLQLSRTLRAGSPPTWLRPKVVSAWRSSHDPHPWKRLSGPRWWAKAAYELTRGVESSGLFERNRRREADAGLSLRAPLLDLDLVQTVLTLPPESSLDPYRNRPLLRAAVAGLVPDEVRLRPGKAWFDELICDCLSGDDAALVRELLVGRSAQLRTYVDVDVLDTELFRSDRMRREQPFEWMWKVWRLLTLECWLRYQAGSPLPQAYSRSRVRLRGSPAMSSLFPS